MNKFKATVLYECATTFKAIWIFYAIQYALSALIVVIIGMSVGDFETIGVSGLEINTLIFVGIVGVLGFKEDFKMLIQNGFTRKHIFFSALSLFAFIAAVMAFVDTLVGNLLHYFFGHYVSLFDGIYGDGNILVNGIWLFFLYLLVCSLFYLSVLVINKMGKRRSVYLGILLGGIIVLVVALFRFVLPETLALDILTLATKAMGFMAGGRINYIFPILTFILMSAVLGMGSYAVIRRIEV